MTINPIAVMLGVVVGLILMAILADNGKAKKSPVVQPSIQPPVVVFDGCEYFKCQTYCDLCVYTHKGNCTNHVIVAKGERQ